MISDILAPPPHDMGLLGHRASEPPRARPWGLPKPPSPTHFGTNPTKNNKKNNINRGGKTIYDPGRRGDIDRADLYTFFFLIFLYICGRVRAEMGRRKWLRWPPWARTRRFGCPVAWHTHVVVWVCQNIVDYGVYTRLGKSRISEEIPENILNRATSPPSTAERQKPPRWTQKVVLGGERGRVRSPTNTPRD